MSDEPFADAVALYTAVIGQDVESSAALHHDITPSWELVGDLLAISARLTRRVAALDGTTTAEVVAAVALAIAAGGDAAGGGVEG